MAALGGYFDSALTAGAETRSLERQLYDSAVAAGAGAAELAVLAAATGEFSDAEIEAAFQAALMQQNIDELVGSISLGEITATEATSALNLLKDGTAATASEAINLTTQATAVQESLDGVSGAAIDAATNLGDIPSDIPVHISITSDPIPAMPTGPQGKGERPPEMMVGGFTGFGPLNEVAGVVHRGELVIPNSALRNGAAGILNFAESNMPGGIGGGGGDTFNIDARGTSPEIIAQVEVMINQALTRSGRNADVRIRTN